MKWIVSCLSIATLMAFTGCSSDFIKQTEYFTKRSLNLVDPITLAIVGEPALEVGECEIYSVTLQTGDEVELDLLASHGSFFRDSLCTQDVSEIMLSAANRSSTFYFRSEEAALQAFISAQARNSNAGTTFNVTINPGSVAVADVSAPASIVSGSVFSASVQFFDQFSNPSTLNAQVQLEYRLQGSSNSFQSLQVVTSNSSQTNFQNLVINLPGTTTLTYELRARELNSSSPVISPFKAIVVSPSAATQVLLDQIGTSLTTSQTYSARVRVRDAGGQPSSALIELITPGYGGFVRVTETCVDTCIVQNLRFTQPASSANPVTLRAQVVGSPLIGEEITGITVIDDVPASIVINNSSFGSLMVRTNEIRSVQVSVYNAAQQAVSASIELLTPGYSGFSPKNQTCNGSCTINNLQFTNVTSTNISLVARVQSVPSINDQLSGISVVSQSIRLAKSVTQGEPAFFDVLQDPRSNSNDVRVLWDFGDGNTAEGRIQAHYYQSANTYTVSVRFQTAQGLSAPETLVHTVSPYSTLSNRTDIFISSSGTAAALNSSSGNPSNWTLARSEIQNIQTSANGGNRAIRVFVRRGDTIQIQANENLVLSGQGRVTIEADRDPAQAALGRPVLLFNAQDGILFGGEQNGFVLRNLVLSGPGAMNRATPLTPYTGETVTFSKVKGNDHFYQNVEFKNAEAGIVGHLNGVNPRNNFNYDFQRKLILGCSFIDIFSTGVVDFGATYVGIQDSSFEYIAAVWAAQIAEARRGIFEDNRFVSNGTLFEETTGVDLPAFSVEAFQDNTSAAVNADLVIQDNSFYNNVFGIGLTGNRDAKRIERVWVKRNKIFADDNLPYPVRNTLGAFRISGVNRGLFQNNVVSTIGRPTLAVVYFEAAPSSNIVIRHNSVYSNAAHALMVASTQSLTNVEISANNIKFDSLNPSNTQFSIFPYLSASPIWVSGVLDFNAMTDAEVSSQIADGNSVLDITGPTLWYRTTQNSRSETQWVNFGKGANNDLNDPLYANIGAHDLRINLGSPAVDRTGADTVFIEQDKDDRDDNNDSGAFEAEDLGGGGPGNGEPITRPVRSIGLE